METSIIVDTHVFLWLNQCPERLSPRIRGLVSLSSTKLYFSAASAFELSIKYYLGKLSLPTTPEKYVKKRIRSADLIELPIQVRHALIAGAFTSAHRDPFDRLLAAQALAENIPLLTADRKMSELACPLLWAT